ncbi:hypothetical protein E6W39_06685 [Kitasatospora acidiphila]|uniref:Uncharacterized protein n=1 Tax=Kitasatospora acidiphila TaxID=2567942 RepID=A0A540VZ43_9ACTN|nr:hypothetical protein [Kitasatospora acidiphila]TQF02020.1 hypothetical protein E6W39_06685 [Kitasatospora acidiphila]
MTTTATPSRSDLAGWLTDAAQAVAAILTAEYSTPATRSYLHPVLGPLAAGPRVVAELNLRLENLLDEPLPATPVGLFTLASYASALGWLTESLAELTTAVDAICTRAGIPVLKPGEAVLSPDEDDEGFDYAFSALELAAIRSAAEAAGMTPGAYIELLADALRAAAAITDACMEISSGLIEDAQDILAEATSDVRIGDGPGSLPTLIRSLLARMEAAE